MCVEISPPTYMNNGVHEDVQTTRCNVCNKTLLN